MGSLYKDRIIMSKRAFFSLLILLLITSCKKETVVLQDELMESAWLFQKVEATNGDIILNGEGEPQILFFFKEDEMLTGRLKGTYVLSENDQLYFQAEIDPYTPIFGGQVDSLAHYPQRYYDFEDITKNGIEGKVEFIESGFDSRFSIQYEPNRKMWFERY